MWGIEKFSEAIVQINEASSVDEMMLIEARARQEYFRCWDIIIGQNDFVFDKRTRRPPQNPLNAMISFGNVFLYRRIASEIHKTALDIQIGILHAANNRSDSLNLDISELFKPIIVDRTIFTVIHNREIQKDQHFEKIDDNAVYLNTEGKRIFIKALERKIYQTITVKGETMTYDSLIRKEIQNLYKGIVFGVKYKPYKYF